jgi:hypothetical protein
LREQADSSAEHLGELLVRFQDIGELIFARAKDTSGAQDTHDQI